MPWIHGETDHDFVGNTGLIGLSAVRFRDKGCAGRTLLSSWIRLWTSIVLSALSQGFFQKFTRGGATEGLTE